jgi:hypothetical protein
MTRTLAVLALLLAASAGDAAPLLQATWSQSIQGLDVTITARRSDGDPQLDIGSGSCTHDFPSPYVQVAVSCPEGLLGSSGTATGTSFSVSLVMPQFTLSQFTTGGAINIHTIATFAGSALITGGASAAAATQGIPGRVTVRAAAHAAKGVNASKLVAFGTTLVRLPLDIGASGLEAGSLSILGSLHYITVDFYGWTPHTLTFTGLTSKFVALPTPTLVAMGSAHLAQGGGTVTIVSPSKISIDGPLAQRRTVSFTSLTLTFPEPSALWLLAVAAAGLAFVRIHSNRRAS